MQPRKVGDEYYYLLECNNIEIADARKIFFTNVKTAVPQLQQLNARNIINYTMNMGDTMIQLHTATFAKNIQTIYRKETDGRNIRHPIIIQTRYGRNIRAPEKLDL